MPDGKDSTGWFHEPKVIGVNATMARYYGAKTLMGYGDGEDKNSRSIYEQPLRLVCVFNHHREQWTEKHEQEFLACLKALNSGRPTP
jgi:hypothetical protein